jgi:hypothetical protein
MKGKRYTMEDKIRILREADRGEKSIASFVRSDSRSQEHLKTVAKKNGSFLL